jgi:hypothetical protein
MGLVLHLSMCRSNRAMKRKLKARDSRTDRLLSRTVFSDKSSGKYARHTDRCGRNKTLCAPQHESAAVPIDICFYVMLVRRCAEK